MPLDPFRQQMVEVMEMYGLRAHTQTQFHAFAAIDGVGYGRAVRATQRRVWWCWCEMFDPQEGQCST